MSQPVSRIKISICNTSYEITKDILPNYLLIHDVKDQLEAKTLQNKIESFMKRRELPKEAASAPGSEYTVTIQAQKGISAVTCRLVVPASEFREESLEALVTRFTKKAIECANQ